MGLYEQVKEVAKSKGYSINRLEKELGFARSSISKFNKNVPSMEKIKQIADFLDVSVSDIIGDNDDASNTEKYYLNDETAQVAQEIFENKELRALFDVQKDMDPADLKALHSMALALKRKERGDIDDTGC
ncbi:helix-turn-helix domain-containing protein [Dorea ammoniilytica]|uniref:Helix-turn-helix domain-containing protein n=1 Tax=Dorea ammoniilytica TaxID=2981788 RepID=A0ABT2S7X4_9FIRM|nr:helix-turn-helix transcriptional regulator [Dorea ammoniilytica]MCU6700695.1 helix-turn-helix domain-containing protein [Dorea ammoniilytica]SCH99368.1 Helix-turn-helix domain [uncultured Eubacterium sp.]